MKTSRHIFSRPSFCINDKIVVDDEGESLSNGNMMAFVPITTKENTAIVRDDFPSILDYLEVLRSQ